MASRTHAENPQLLSVASSIAKGEPVDWVETAVGEDSETTAVLDELRLLEGLARMNDPIPDAWGPFTIIGEIGHGSYGTVYQAVDPALDIEVALKVIRPRVTHGAIDPGRALREARLLAQVNHPGVVRVYRAERVGDEVGVSMELVKGRTLHDLVRRGGPLGAGEAILIGIALCRALAAVHAARLVHGDIKAQNVMCAEGGRIVLMDFGAGHDLKHGTPRHGTGTPLYMAPEVFGGAPPSTASDIYSLGVLVFHLVTGSYPVKGDTRTEVRHQHEQRTRRQHLRDLKPDLPDAFIRVVERATAEVPSDRHRTAGALEAALDGALRNQLAPLPPPPPPPWPTGLLVAASVAAAIGMGALVTSGWLQREPSNASVSTLGSTLTSTPSPAQAAIGSYSIEAAFYRQERGADIRLDSGASVVPGDQLSLQVAASKPLYVYVVNEDERGESYLLFPLPGQSLANPLAPDVRHRLPGMRGNESVYWQVTSAGGREHFVVFASPDPPPATLARFLEALPRPARDQPVTAHRLPEDTVATLRGVGGLVHKPSTGAPPRLADVTAATLSGRREEAKGMWVRELTLENPGK